MIRRTLARAEGAADASAGGSLMEFAPWEENWDTVIIGGGPGGVSAAIYAIRGELKTLLIEKAYTGGQIALTNEVENYPGFPSVSGMELAQKLDEHLKKFNTPILNKTVERLTDNPDGGYFVELVTGEKVATKTIIIATGSRPNLLKAKNAERHYGKGVSYCAVCDGPFFKGQDVIVVGGGDAAMEEAQYLATVCGHVTVVHRRQGFRAQPIALSRTKELPNVRFKLDYVITEVLGEEKVTGVKLKNTKTGEEEEMATSAVFVYIGHTPNTQFAEELLKLAETGEIFVDARMRTEKPGVFAAGDATYMSLKQMTISVGEGATAAIEAGRYILTGDWPRGE
jgi:thioredoxin reductase (NADPH)